MHKKQIEELAKIIKQSSSLACQKGKFKHVLDRQTFMLALCDFLKSENNNFDEFKFRQDTGEILGIEEKTISFPNPDHFAVLKM